MTTVSKEDLAHCLEHAELRGRSLKDIFTDAERRLIVACIRATIPADTQAMREATIEECAKACERRIYGKDGLTGGNDYGHYAPYNAEATACAKAVRALAATGHRAGGEG